MKALPSFAVLVLLASCVRPPQTFDEAIASRDGKLRNYPMCSSSIADLFAGSFTKPAADLGNGMVAVVKESFAEGPMVREAQVVDCETGLGLTFTEGGEGVPESRFNALFSSEPGFLSPVESFLAGVPSSGRADDVFVIANEAKLAGLDPRPSIKWLDASGGWSKSEECACELYYPKIERNWFDKSKVGPGYPEALGAYPTTLQDLRLRMDALRAAR
jgi:hypothetical protein